MVETRISGAVASDLSSVMTSYAVTTETTDGAQDTNETEYQLSNFDELFGNYINVPEVQAVIDAKATWTVGKGFNSSGIETFVADSIKGIGIDTFNTILENMIRTYNIAGDSYCEIIRDKKGMLINLKPLDPSTIKIIANKAGRIKRYEQTNKGHTKKFAPNKIFHLSRNRVADNIHGTSMITALKDVILQLLEAEDDYKTLLHRFVKPRWIIHLDTDDPTEIANFKTKYDNANANGENLYIPKGTVELEQVAVAPNSTLNPLPWIESRKNKFFQAAGVPQIIVGGGNEFTEASAKIAYLAFQQTIEEEQLYIEEQVGMQLGIEIDLQFPASLENELLSDKKKDGAQNIDASETTAGAGQ